MRNYGRATTLLFLLLFSLTCAFGEAPFPETELLRRFTGLTGDDLTTLKTSGELTRYFFKGQELSFFPNLPGDINSAITSDITDSEPTVGVESLFLLKVPGLFDSKTEEGNNRDLLTIYNTLRSVSSLEGVEYYSASRGRMRVFFKEAYVIENALSRKRVPDPLVQEIPAEEKFLIHQKDLTFGKNISEAVYRYSKEVMSLSLTNLEIMRYALVPFIKEGGMQTHLIVFPMEGYIGFYAYCGVETISFLGIEKSKSDSFYNRMKALYTWFRENLPEL